MFEQWFRVTLEKASATQGGAHHGWDLGCQRRPVLHHRNDVMSEASLTQGEGKPYEDRAEISVVIANLSFQVVLPGATKRLERAHFVALGFGHECSSEGDHFGAVPRGIGAQLVGDTGEQCLCSRRIHLRSGNHRLIGARLVDRDSLAVLSCEQKSWLQFGGSIVPVPGKKAEFTGQHQHVRTQPSRPELLRLFECSGVGLLRLVEAVGISQCHAEKEVREPVSGLIVPRIEGEGDSTPRQQERFPVTTLGLHRDRQCRQTPDGHRRTFGPLGNCECSPGGGLSANKVASEDPTVARVGMQKGLVLE